MTPMPASPFMNPSVISPRTERSAVVSKPPPAADATAAPFHSSDGGGEQTTPADASLTMEPMGGCDTIEAPSKAGTVPSPSEAIPFNENRYQLSDDQDVPARMQESKARQSGLARDDEKPGDTTQESRPAHPATASSETIPSNEGRPQEASAPAPTKNPDADALDLTDCISEIFFYARKLMKQPPRFVLDADAFMAEIEEVPLFLRDDDGYLRRQA